MDPAVREAIWEVVRGVRREVEAALGNVRWVAPAAYHFTLRFLGELDADRVGAAVRATRRACAGLESFPVTLRSLGAFPGLERPRVLWIGVDDEGNRRLTHLALRLQEELAREGFAAETRLFASHLTIGRLSDRAGHRPPGALQAVARLFDRDFGPSRSESVVVMKSELRPSGPVYTAMHRVALGARAPEADRAAGGSPASQEGV